MKLLERKKENSHARFTERVRIHNLEEKEAELMCKAWNASVHMDSETEFVVVPDDYVCKGVVTFNTGVQKFTGHDIVRMKLDDYVRYYVTEQDYHNRLLDLRYALINRVIRESPDIPKNAKMVKEVEMIKEVFEEFGVKGGT